MADASTLAARIVRAMRVRGYALDTGAGERNIVYVRGLSPDGVANDNAPDAFNDLRIVISFEKDEPRIVRAWTATVEPGVKYVKHRINPKGAAFIVDGRQRAWQVGLHRGHHEALVQSGGPVTVTRDDNADANPAGDERDSGWFGINQHGGYDQPQDSIGGASAGCLVTPAMRDQAEFMALIKSDPRYRADPKFVFATTVLSAADVLADGAYVAPAPTVASAEQRRRMAKAIFDFEAQKDSRGRLTIYVPPGNDGGGAYEIAGINVRYHPQQAQRLKELIEAGRYAEAEQAAIAYIAGYTEIVAGWGSDLGVEFYLRDTAFNRGPTGAARILQRALAVAEDGIVGPITRGAAAKVAAAQLLTALRAAREAYERDVVGVRENLWRGLVSRWDQALALAQAFSAETRPLEPTEILPPVMSGRPGSNPLLLVILIILLTAKEKPMANDPSPAPAPPPGLDIEKLLTSVLLQALSGRLALPPPAQSPPPSSPPSSTPQPALIETLLPVLIQLLTGKPPAPPVPPPPPPPEPALQKPSVQLGAFGLAITTLLQALGIVGTPFGIGEAPTQAGTIATLAPVLTALVGATGGFGMLIKIGLALASGLLAAKKPKP